MKYIPNPPRQFNIEVLLLDESVTQDKTVNYSNSCNMLTWLSRLIILLPCTH